MNNSKEFFMKVSDNNCIKNAEKLQAYSARKLLSLRIAELYEKSGAYWRYGGKIRGCAENMLVKSYESGEKEVVYTLFCGCRLCPVCQSRRSLKAFAQLSQLLDHIDRERVSRYGAPWEYVLVTLTLQSMPSEQLGEMLDMMIDAQQRVIRSKAWQSAFKGAWRTLEVTYNANMDTVHPHLHFLCAVNPSYFSSRDYISQDKLARLWMKSARIPYQPIVDIRRVRSVGGAKAEVSKYITKPATELFSLPDETGVRFISALHEATFQRKSYATYGIIRAAFRALHLSDEDGQLLDPAEGDEALLASMRPDVRYVYDVVTWNARHYQYEKADDFALETAFPSSALGVIRAKMGGME